MKRVSIVLSLLLLWSIIGTTVHATTHQSTLAEGVILEIMQTRYTHPSAATVGLFAKWYDISIPDVAEEARRAQDEATGILTTAAVHGWEFRDSKVQVDIVSVTQTKGVVTAEARVNVEWYWGYHNLPTETPMELYNLHELKLAKSGDSWRVIADRNLASKNNPIQKASPAPVVETNPAGDVSVHSIYSYNRTGARDYAYSRWNSPNPVFPDFSSDGGDCTNFSSQVIYLGGGYPFTWGSDRNTGWWYSTSTSYSWSWSLANEQAYFMRTNYGSYVTTPTSTDGTTNNLKNHPANAKNSRLGDIMYYSRDNSTFNHSAVVTSFDSQGFPRVTYRNGGGGTPAKDAVWTLPSNCATLIRGLNMLDYVEVI